MASVSQVWLSEDEVVLARSVLRWILVRDALTPSEEETRKNLLWKLDDISVSCPWRQLDIE